MSAQQKPTDHEIDHLLNLVREHWPEVFDYEEGIANKALNRIQDIAEKAASLGPKMNSLDSASADGYKCL